MSSMEIDKFRFTDPHSGAAAYLELSVVDDSTLGIGLAIGAGRRLDLTADRSAAQAIDLSIMQASNAASTRQMLASNTLKAAPAFLLEPSSETFTFVDRRTQETAAVGFLVFEDSKIGLYISERTCDDTEIVADLPEVMRLLGVLTEVISAMSSRQLTALPARRKSKDPAPRCAVIPGKRASRAKADFGPSRPCDELTTEDFARFPVWVWALDEEGIEGKDETWVKPLVSGTDVGDEIAYSFPLLTLWIPGTDWLVVGDYDHAADSVSFHFVRPEDQQAALAELKRRGGPVILEAVATILGVAGVRFECGGCDPGMYAWEAWRID